MRRSPLAMVLAASTILTSTVASTLALGGELEDRVKEYEEAKREWKGQSTGKARGGGRRGGGGKPRKRPELQPKLVRIAKLGTDKSVGYLAREYRDIDAEIASMAGVAILASGHGKAVSLVTKGFDRRGKWSLGARVRVLDALATAGDDGVAFVVKLAKRGKSDLRPLALGSLALAPESDEARETLLDALGHRSPILRRSAVRALRKFRGKSLITGLIEQLEEEGDDGLRLDILRLLVARTGENMGLVAADWKKWWEIAQPRFNPNAKRDEGRTVRVTPDLTYHGIEVASTRVSFLVDASLSMEGGKNRRGGGAQRPTKLAQMKKELTRIIEKLPEETLINIIFFHRRAVPWKKELHPLRGKGRKEAIEFVRDLTTEFGTNIYDTLEQALDDRRVDTIFLLTDGRPYGGKYTNPRDIVREISAINRLRGAKIHTISFGAEMEYLENLAERNGGDYRAVGAGGKKGAGKKGSGKNGGGKNDGGKNDGGKNDGGKNDGGKNDGGDGNQDKDGDDFDFRSPSRGRGREVAVTRSP